ncbi:MAG: glycosyltransferase [Roseococcus sp.]|nr:glycosyltransferase [Roseococcus sp.]
MLAKPDPAPVAARLASRIAEYSVDPAGCLNLVVFSQAGQLPRFSFETSPGELTEVMAEEAKFLPIAGTDLLKDPALSWEFRHAGRPRSGRNHSPATNLPGLDVHFLGSLAGQEGTGPVAATAALRHAEGQEGCAVLPRTTYRLTALTGLQRCEARLVITCLDAEGRDLHRDVRPLSGERFGGPSIQDYEAVSVIIATPEGCARLRIEIEKGPTTRRETSYVFFADVTLRRLSAGAQGPSYPLPARFNDISAFEGLEALSLRLRPPPTGRTLHTSLHMDFGVATEMLPDLVFPARALPLELRRMTLTHRRLAASGRIGQGVASGQQLGAFVDGELSATGELLLAQGGFEAEIFLDLRHMDGLLHLVELRHLPSHQVLGALTDILSHHVTPWQTIQVHAGAPLDINGSPAARFHFATYRAWLEAAGKPHWRPQPDLLRLHDDVLAGLRKRAHYPKLSLPQAASPEVSIVIPAHNAFEATYLCIASLIFAFSEASFEVILVDDGSTDMTVQAEMIFEGVRILRHAEPQGFVGACNAGARLARGRFIAFLNNDTEVTSRWLDELLAVFANFDDVGLAGAKLLYPNGRLQEAGGLVWNSGNPWNVGRHGNAADPRYNYLRQVDYLSGAAILIPRPLWAELGGFAPEFAPGYFEDTDLAMRVRQAGRKVVYVPSAQVVHFEGQSSGTSITTGMKRFQEVNRPKFKRKWAHLFATHGKDGQNADREKDRHATLRVLFVDHRYPFVDADAGGYAAYQEIRLLQSVGAKVTFLPRNLAYMDRHVLALQRIGVECLHAPFVTGFEAYVEKSARDYDLIYVNRYAVAQDIMEIIRRHAPAAKIAFNLADLHFLRELREAAAGNEHYTAEGARITRDAELAMVRASDLTLSYSDTELAVLESHLLEGRQLAKLPWVVEVNDALLPKFEASSGLLFVGGFRHPPNIAAVEFLAREVMPILAQRAPEIVLEVVGSNPPESILALAASNIRVLGQVPDLDPVFARARVFLAPLFAGAGMKGKVLEAISRGVPSVLSSIAAEGIGLTPGSDYLLARSPEEWARAIQALHGDAARWQKLRDNALAIARTRYGFEAGREMTREWLAKLDLYDRGGSTLVHRGCRPWRYGA